MNIQRITGLGLVAVGVILLVMGLNASDSFSDRMSKFFTGHLTDHTVWFLVGGVGLLVVGGGLASGMGGKTSA